MLNWGKVPLASVLPFFFDTFDGGTGASITLTGLALGDVLVYKGTSMTQRASTAGFVLLDTDGIDVDTVTGIHGFSIDTGDNTDAGFFVAGSFYTVVVSSVTIDAQTVSFVAGTFWLGPTLTVAGVDEVDVTYIAGAIVSTSTAQLGVNAVQAGGTAWGSGAITAASIAADAITAAKVADDVSTEIANKVLDTDMTAHQIQGTLGQAIGDPVADTNTIYKAVVTDATGATVGVDVVAVKAETVSIQADTDNIQTRLPAALVSGRMDSDVAVIQANVITAGVIANGAIDAATFAAGAIDAAAIATGAIDADALASDAVTEARSIVSGTADSGSTTTMVDAARTEADTDYWKDLAILFTSGTISGQARLITAFNAATDTITFSPATTQAVGTNTYEILPNVAAAGASAPTAVEVAAAVWNEDATAHQTQGTFGQAIGDPVADTNTIYKGVVTDATGATVGVDVVAVKAETASIQTDTNDIQTKIGTPAGASISADLLVIDNFVDGLETTIGAAGAGLTAVPWNAAWDVEVESEVNDALVVQRLDELVNADSDIDGLAPPTVGSVVHELLSKTAGSFTYDQTTDSLEAIRDKETDIETDTAEIGAAGAGLTAINLPNQTMDIVGNITGNLSGSVGSVTGAVGSVTGLTAATVHSDLDDIQTRLPAALIGGRMDSDVEAINNSTVAADVLAILNGAAVVYQGTVTGAATTTTLIDSGLTAADTDYYKGRILIFTSGALVLQATDCVGFTPASDTITFTATTVAPTAGMTYVLI